MHLTMKLEQVVRQDVSYVELEKDGRNAFGITFADGTGDQEGPIIKKLKPKSLAERCHALSEGDVLLSLNGLDVTGIQCKNIKRMIRDIESKVNFKLQYRIRETCISRSVVYYKKQMTTRLKKLRDSFGFVLRKRDSQYSFTAEFPVISNIKKGGPADIDGLMQDGDRLLKVDEMSLSWVSLADVAVILMKKTEAKFTFEYNVRKVDLDQSFDKIIALDIDIPIVNLGIILHRPLKEPGVMCISSIQLCSVAERCGVFSLGDIILSVNDIGVVEFSTISEGKTQLQNGGHIRKISFISTRKRELPKPISVRNSFCHHKDKYAINSESSLDAQSLDKEQHFNTSASTNITISVPRKILTMEAYQREQVQAIKMFFDMLKYMTDLKKNLSVLTRRAFEGKYSIANKEDCTACNKTQHSVKLCASCISKVNVKCAQSMGLLRNIVAYFVKMSLKQENYLPLNTEAQTTNVRNHIKGPTLENLIRSLTEILPKVFDNKLELQRSFKTLAQKISKADNSCKTEIDSVSLTVQRLLLLIYLGNPTAEINALINQLVYCLLETKLPCEEVTDSSDSSYEENSFTESENDSQSRLLPSGESTSEMKNVPQNIDRSESEEIIANSDQNLLGSVPETSRLNVNLNQRLDYMKLIDIQSYSDSDISTANEQNEAIGFNIDLPHPSPLLESSGTSVASTLELNLLEKSKKSNKSTESTKCGNKIIYKDKGLLNISAKMWRSAESVLNPNNASKVQSAARNEFQENSKQHKIKSSNEVVIECSLTDPPQRSTALGAKYIYRASERNISESNHESMESSKDQKDEIKKNHVETMHVNLLNEGEGFGFVLGFSSPKFLNTLPVPIIKEVKPNSPAHKSGVIAQNDRVIAINSKNMVGVPLKDLENMKRLVFNSKQITLTLEFDVMDTPMKFGTFDVVLDKTLKIGLLFEDMDKGSPMVVTGVVKGSASHRSGKLFPGDKVALLKCIRNEEFNPISYEYTREEFAKITVLRDRSEVSGIKESPIPSNPFSYNPGSNLQKGPNFIVKRTSIHSAGHNDVLVLDQEVTLFRDPVTWDFGFLVGENPNTGRAYITNIRTNGPAGSSGVMKKFDRLVEINGVAVGKDEACSVLSLLTQTNGKVDLLIRRVYQENS